MLFGARNGSPVEPGKSRRMKRPEQAIHKAVVSHLNARSYPGTFFFHPANGGKRTPFEARLFKALGVVAGVPDLIILKGGHVFALELKSATGRLLPSQEQTIWAMHAAGAEIAIAKSLDEALVTLECWGVLRRAA